MAAVFETDEPNRKDYVFVKKLKHHHSDYVNKNKDDISYKHIIKCMLQISYEQHGEKQFVIRYINREVKISGNQKNTQ